MSESETIVEPLVSAPEKSIVFMARREELKLVRIKERQRHDAEGNVIETIPGQGVRFVDGVLRINPTQKHMRGEKGEQLETAEILEWLEHHHLNGDRLEGFWQLDTPAPPMSEAEQDKLTELAQALDVDGLRRFINEERDGWGREQVVAVAKRALERAESRQAEHAEEIAKARAAGEAAAKKPAAKPADAAKE